MYTINDTEGTVSQMILELGMADAKKVAVRHVIEERHPGIVFHWDLILLRLKAIEDAR